MVEGSSRRNLSNRAATYRDSVFGEGSFKVVYRGTYTSGRRRGEACVVKEMRSGSSWLESVFDNELEVVNRAVEIVDKFNNAGHVSKPILMNTPEVWEYTDDHTNQLSGIAGAKNLVEPMIQNFQKFNSNSGWVLKDQQLWTKVMQV
jgi:hypothetical protein